MVSLYVVMIEINLAIHEDDLKMLHGVLVQQRYATPPGSRSKTREDVLPFTCS
jgi:hypothetical protein